MSLSHTGGEPAPGEQESRGKHCKVRRACVCLRNRRREFVGGAWSDIGNIWLLAETVTLVAVTGSNGLTARYGAATG